MSPREPSLLMRLVAATEQEAMSVVKREGGPQQSLDHNSKHPLRNPTKGAYCSMRTDFFPRLMGTPRTCPFVGQEGLVTYPFGIKDGKGISIDIGNFHERSWIPEDVHA